jgi:hypothetical protein
VPNKPSLVDRNQRGDQSPEDDPTNTDMSVLSPQNLMKRKGFLKSQYF